MRELVIGAGELEVELVRVFAEISAGRAPAVRLIFPASITPNQHLAERLREHVSGTPSLQTVVLCHSSPGIRFVASMLTLQVKGVRFEASTTTEPEDVPRDRTRPSAGAGPGVPVVAPIDPDDLPRSIRGAFGRARESRARAVVLLFDPRLPIERRLVGLIGDAITELLTLEILVLVHPDKPVGFLASGLSLRCPRVRVVPCASETEARSLARVR